MFFAKGLYSLRDTSPTKTLQMDSMDVELLCNDKY